jgi:hypothetical protein
VVGRGRGKGSNVIRYLLQDFVFPDAKNRAHLNHFHKLAEKKNFDISR